MSDLINIRMSAEASSNFGLMCEKFQFKTETSALKFAIMYALKNFKDSIDYELLEKTYPNDGTNLNVGSIDDDGTIKRLIPILYPGCDTPYRYARVAGIFGSIQIRKLMDANASILLSDLMQ